MSQIDIKINKKACGIDQGFGSWIPVEIPRDITNLEEKFLYVVSNLLASERKNAWDHERDFNEDMFFGAALIKTINNQYYVSANVHLQNDKTSRCCAEANAITNAVTKESIYTQISDVWFMGGKGNAAKNIDIYPNEEGQRVSPCGSCRDVIFNNKLLSANTRIHMLPLNDGSWHLTADNGCAPDKLNRNQVMTRTIDELLPKMPHIVVDNSGKIKTTMQAGWELINDPHVSQAIGEAFRADKLNVLSGMKNKSPEQVLRLVNELMVDSLADINAKSINNGLPPMKIAKIAVVKLDNGEFYQGISYVNPKVSAMQSAESDAIQNALKNHPGHHITDIFVMSVDFEKTPEIIASEKSTPVEINMPDGAIRDRISKVGPRHDQIFRDIFDKKIDKESGASIHVMILNNKTDFNPKLHVHSFSLRELLPFRFMNPKAGAGHSNILNR